LLESQVLQIPALLLSSGRHPIATSQVSSSGQTSPTHHHPSQTLRQTKHPAQSVASQEASSDDAVARRNGSNSIILNSPLRLQFTVRSPRIRRRQPRDTIITTVTRPRRFCAEHSCDTISARETPRLDTETIKQSCHRPYNLWLDQLRALTRDHCRHRPGLRGRLLDPALAHLYMHELWHHLF
jgi:hypothetical protein